ncbi:MAG: ATP phosphoribosyltransferase [Anaerolineae bacterium]
MTRTDIRLALPSKGVLQSGAIEFLTACGLKVYRPNPRQYAATLPALPGVTVLFQRPGDIVVGVRQGSVDFGITGLDVLAEKGNVNGGHPILTLHDELGFGPCTLNLAVPEDLPARTVADVAKWAEELANDGRSLRIATKFPRTTRHFLQERGVTNFKLINAEGTLEIAPAIGYADLIADLVSSGVTLRDNHLRPLDDGEILRSQACLIAHREALQTRPDVLAVARQLLEYIEAHLRAAGSYLVIANIRGDSPAAIARKMAAQPHIGGLQGPTIAPVYPPQGETAAKWFSISIVVRKQNLVPAIAELRAIGGSGVIVSPLTYIFEEEPMRFQAMLSAIKG